MIEMFVKVEFEFNKKNTNKFSGWLDTKPDGFKTTVMSKDQIQ